jgi:hypothetical protein
MKMFWKWVIVLIEQESECSWALVAHTCNPSYSGGRDQEDRGSKPAPAGSRPCLEKHPSQKRTGGVAQGVQTPVVQK